MARGAPASCGRGRRTGGPRTGRAGEKPLPSRPAGTPVLSPICSCPVELSQLAGLVGPVPGGPVDTGRPEQPDRVVVAQHPDRYPAVACELPDGERELRFTASHSVRVKALPERACHDGVTLGTPAISERSQIGAFRLVGSW